MGYKYRIEPGGIFDFFDSDAGWDSLSYCHPGLGSATEASSGSIRIEFTDDEGGRSIVQATAPVTK
jgi:hypothetical protein